MTLTVVEEILSKRGMLEINSLFGFILFVRAIVMLTAS
jgi:hypothetical protein